MENKLKRKMLWLDAWDIEEQEAWFSHMSLQGWKLIGISKWMAEFEKCEPQKVNYRCDVFKLNDKSENNRIEFYKQSGWEHIATRGFIQVFRDMKGDNSLEIHTDPIEQAATLSILKQDITKRGILTLLLSVITLMLIVGAHQIDPVGNYLNDKFIETIVLIIAYMSISITMVNGMIHMSKLMKRLKSGSLLEHEKSYHRKIKRNKVVGITVIFILSLWVLTVFLNLMNSLQEDRFPAIPKTELPIVQMADFIDDFTYIDEEGLSYFKENSSFLVPRQYQLEQMVEVPGETWEDNSDIYSPSISSFGYEVRSEWLAKKFVQDLKEKHTYYAENYVKVPESKFDELWLSQGNFNAAFIARKHNKVYRVLYYGKGSIDEIIERALAKAER
ncbi:DUF2812 domain-containing protein [Neobacillus novalis]|uniref:DUF2812 domain-containing protein n=2 Tax=Neobacillus novalis TaxID=220687 RepID=A0AA95S9B3_9BACI|nr:DUF2812 domain-containing protein [Neobacillus novalis]WHY86790.1 DUF2812 domain-containing protein [Neobacillus novalis]